MSVINRKYSIHIQIDTQNEDLHRQLLEAAKARKTTVEHCIAMWLEQLPATLQDGLQDECGDGITVVSVSDESQT